MLARARRAVLLGLLALPLAGNIGEAADPPPPPGAARDVAAAAAVPVAEVATRAAELATLLRGLQTRLAPSPELEIIRKSLPALRQLIDLELAAAKTILQAQPSLDMLQAQQQLWQQRQLQTTTWLTALTLRATHLEQALAHLANLRKTWLETRTAAQASKAPEPILAQIETALTIIELTERPLLAQRTAVLDLQGVVAQEVARCSAALAEFTQAQQLAVGGLLARISPPLWSALTWNEMRTALPARLPGLGTGYRTEVVRYATDPWGMPLHVAVLAALAMLLSAAGRRSRRWATAAEGRPTATAVLDRPYAATVALALVAVASPYSLIPPSLRNLLVVLGLAAALRLTQPVVDRRIVLDIYLLWALFAIDSLRRVLAGVQGIEQMFLTLEPVAGLALLGYSLNRGGLRLSSAPHETERLLGLRAGVVLVMVGFAIALVAGVVGYVRLSRLLIAGILGSGALALTLYAGVRVLMGIVAYALRVWPLRLLLMVRDHRELLEQRLDLLLVLAAILGWGVRVLDYVGLFQPVLSMVQAVLVTELGRGTIRISVGSMLEFVVTVWLAYLFSAFIRFVLREDVYPRTHLTRGISYAISSLLNYVIIALGFLLALGVLGMDLNKVTILASAFGVGIGFGLQSVVNNFVSGLILLFERPIHVGDIVEVGDLSGEVSRIGIRASTVRTWQGAEIIVPNAQLITERVTNWTLSDRTRRIDLKVGVDYGSAPDKVVEVLVAVARAHPDIMQTPAPQAVFSAFGDSSINFQLRAWTNRFERWPQIQTELAAGIYAALHAAGMSLPFPQREVRVLHDSPAGGAADPPKAAGDAARPPGG